MESDEQSPDQRLKYLQDHFLKDLQDSFRELEHEVSQRTAPLTHTPYDWLHLALSVTMDSPTESGTTMEFDLKFINSSEEPHEFPTDMSHWKNNHPCHLVFETTEGDPIPSIRWAHAITFSEKRETAPLMPGDYVSIHFTATLTPSKLLDFRTGAYDLSSYGRVVCRYKYGGQYSAPTTIEITAAHNKSAHRTG